MLLSKGLPDIALDRLVFKRERRAMTVLNSQAYCHETGENTTVRS
jgi:hypothetical protein